MCSSSISLCVSGSDAASGNDASKKYRNATGCPAMKNTFLMGSNPTKTRSTLDMLKVKGCDPHMFVFRANHHHHTNHNTDTKQH